MRREPPARVYGNRKGDRKPPITPALRWSYQIRFSEEFDQCTHTTPPNDGALVDITCFESAAILLHATMALMGGKGGLLSPKHGAEAVESMRGSSVTILPTPAPVY
mmetsp:Transcript_19727/g.39274  ORF Transcript_19727/g.39274 Transcript_19727/m.39274 type:complete len:106 (-) Transcript_19727:46-363(-)